MSKKYALLWLLAVGAILPLLGEDTLQPVIACPLNQPKQPKGRVAICMMFQNEQRFLREWLCYHKAIGVNHFYLYDNASDNDCLQILEPYVQRGEVELYYFPEKSHDVAEHNNLQKKAYNHALKRAKGHYRWLAAIDADEFICLTRRGHLPRFLKDYRYAAGLALNWVMYGSAGIRELEPAELQIERLNRRAPQAWGEHFLVKSIVKVKDVQEMGIHVPKYKMGRKAVFANHQRFSHTPLFSLPPIEDIRINHYWWRDESYFQNVKLARRSGWLSNYTAQEIQERRELYNSVEDGSMRHLIGKVKRQLKKDQRLRRRLT